MLKTIGKIGVAYIALETWANFGKGYAIGVMQVFKPEHKDLYDWWHDGVEYNPNHSLVDRAKTACIRFGEGIGKRKAEKIIKS